MEIICMDNIHYDSVQHFIEEEYLEKLVEEKYLDQISDLKEEDLKDGEDTLEAYEYIAREYAYDVIDVVAEDHLKKRYPKDYWCRSLVWKTDEWSDGVEVIYYKAELNNKEEATKFIIDTIQRLGINSTDLFSAGIENLK